jgi:hypothetical protein
MAWRWGALLLVAAGVFVSAALAVGPPGAPILPISGPITTGPTTTGSTTTAPAPVPPNGAPGLTATLSSRQAGARPVALTLAFDGTLLCGRPRGATAVTLPAAADVPAAVPASTVTINGRLAGRVAVTGSTLTVLPAPTKGMTCFSIREGTVRVSFSRTAGLGNPAVAGTYPVVVHRGHQALRGTLTIQG